MSPRHNSSLGMKLIFYEKNFQDKQGQIDLSLFSRKKSETKTNYYRIKGYRSTNNLKHSPSLNSVDSTNRFKYPTLETETSVDEDVKRKKNRLFFDARNFGKSQHEKHIFQVLNDNVNGLKRTKRKSSGIFKIECRSLSASKADSVYLHQRT